jgi:DNA-binding response OmpR family regulator
MAAMPRVLLIEDDTELCDVLGMALEDAGHTALTAHEGGEGLRLAREARPDVVISDVNLPVLDGFAITRRLRAAGDATPILLLTSRDSEIDEALGLELGADDYVTKPFSTRVLLARVEALLRRTQLAGEARGDAALTSGALAMWPERLEVRLRDRPVPMTVTEFRLLEAMIRRPGVVLSRERLLELVRDDGSVVAGRLIDTYVRRLRKKLGEIDESFDRIETVIGAGYRWSDR